MKEFITTQEFSTKESITTQKYGMRYSSTLFIFCSYNCTI